MLKINSFDTLLILDELNENIQLIIIISTTN